jgi:hypothetical protein
MSDQLPPADQPGNSPATPPIDGGPTGSAQDPALQGAVATAETPPEGQAGPGKTRLRLTGDAIIEAIIYGSPAVITVLAIFMALVVSALLIVFSDPGVLHAWAAFFNAPGQALSLTWQSISTAYSALFE